MARRRRRSVAAKRIEAAPLTKLIELEHKVERELEQEARVARHALDRTWFWGGVSLMTLSVVLFLHGVTDVLYLTTGFAGVLAMVFE